MDNYSKITSRSITEMTNLTDEKKNEESQIYLQDTINKNLGEIDSTDYELPIEKDIPITQEISSGNYYKNKKKFTNVKSIRKGNMIMTLYNKDGEPLIVIGPHWPFTICMMIFIDGLCFSFFYFLWNLIHWVLRDIGVVLAFIQASSYLFVFLKNPGIPPKDLWIENYFKNTSKKGDVGSYKICNICKIVMKSSDNTNHCEECNMCIVGISHHCSWISKCVSKKNKIIYYIFCSSSIILLIFFIPALISIFFNKSIK